MINFSSKRIIDITIVVFLGIHRGVLVSIIPFGLGLISYRFFIIAIESLTKLINPTWQPVGESNSEGD